DKSTCQRQFLFHSSAQPARETVSEPVHAEHREITRSAFFDLLAGKATQVAHITEVFRNTEIVVKTEDLGQVANIRTGIPCRVTKQEGFARRRRHDAAENLKD